MAALPVTAKPSTTTTGSVFPNGEQYPTGSSSFLPHPVTPLVKSSCRLLVNQQITDLVEFHPRWRQSKLREFCRKREIHVSAYSPLGAPGSPWGSKAVIDSPILKSIAHKHNATPAQVALRWAIEKGLSVIAKSFNEERMKENLGALELRLDQDDHFEMEKLEEKKLMRGEFLVNSTTSPYKTIQELWDGEI